MRQMKTPIQKMIDASVKCVKCGAAGVGTCDCWKDWACACVLRDAKKRQTHIRLHPYRVRQCLDCKAKRP